jgi:lysophospholipase L1-like esterase
VTVAAGAFALTVAVVVLGACSIGSTGPDSGPSPLPRQVGCSVASVPDSLCILVLGDSLAAGTPVTADDRWWPRLKALLSEAMPDRTVVVDSWAIAGSQVHVLESAAWDQPEVRTYQVAIVIEGVNDAHLLPVERWRQRYEAAVAALEGHGLTVIVTTPPPRYENASFDPRYDGVAAAVRDLAVAHTRPLLDLAARWRADGPARAASYYADPIHQSVAGQELMANLARDTVLEYIVEQGEP